MSELRVVSESDGCIIKEGDVFTVTGFNLKHGEQELPKFRGEYKPTIETFGIEVYTEMRIVKHA